MNSITNLTPEELRRAADFKERIESLERELAQILGSAEEMGVEAPPKRGRRLSAKGLANIRAGVRKRVRMLGGTNGPVEPARKRKYRRSAAQRARLSAIAKARWKKARAEGKSTL